MRFDCKWICSILDENDYFDACVPGNAQYDYAKAHGWGDVNYGNNCFAYKELEEKSWIYKTKFSNIKEAGKKVFFVSFGIDYECDIFINSKHVFHHIGMFEKIDLDITNYIEDENTLEVVIMPPPKDPNCPTIDRSQAAQSTKAAVSYGWDWHPRLIPTGIWQDTYLEVRGEKFVKNVEIFYTLNDEMTSADIRFEVECDDKVHISIWNPEGKNVYNGNELEVHLDHVKLWWCNGQGKPNLYKYVVVSEENEVSGYIGFKKIELVMNEGAWDEPSDFPKSRSVAPITLKLNGRKIFVKGSNWVAPEIFYGNIKFDTYNNLLMLVKEANMNLLRCWGGAVVGKKVFYELCDKYGIMVWQEFPLACNDYYASEAYLKVLEQEARYIIKMLRSHACIVIWCGGNELFNRWSGMTDQSLALRLLNKLCYELDRDKPFLMTAPLMGMGHGHYMFYDKNTNKTIYDIYSNSQNTAYSEFGVPSISSMEQLKKIIPEEYFDKIEQGTVWETHHGFNSWDVGDADTWLCFSVIDKFFGKQSCLEDYIECSLILQGEGLKYIFEEARRQKPYCSMAMNWCFNEPWITAANQSIVSYPAIPKKSYECVKEALRPMLPSLKPTGFKFNGGDEFNGELWLLNDSQKEIEAIIEVYLVANRKETHIMTWNTKKTDKNTNKKGHTIRFTVPNDFDGEFKVVLKSNLGNSTYRFWAEQKNKREYVKSLNA